MIKLRGKPWEENPGYIYSSQGEGYYIAREYAPMHYIIEEKLDWIIDAMDEIVNSINNRENKV